jgi:hypothetical protein
MQNISISVAEGVLGKMDDDERHQDERNEGRRTTDAARFSEK